MPTDNQQPLTRADLEAFEGRIADRLKTMEQRLSEHIDERTHGAETRLLRAFGDYQKAESIRFVRLKADVGNIDQATDQRLAALEDRITRIDARLIEKGI